MAYVLLSRRLSPKLVTKSSIHSSSSPDSYLITHYELLNPKISSSISSIYHRNYNSTSSTPYYSSIKNPSKPYADYSSKLSHLSLTWTRKRHPNIFYEKVRYFSSSSEDDKNLDDDELSKVEQYFSSDEGEKFLYKVSKGKYFPSRYREFFKVLPKDPLNNITRKDFRKGAEILLEIMNERNSILTAVGSFPLIVTLVAYKYPIAPFCFLYGCMVQYGAANERRSMKKVKSLMQDQRGQIRNLFLQLLYELRKSDDRNETVAISVKAILFVTAFVLFVGGIHYLYG